MIWGPYTIVIMEVLVYKTAGSQCPGLLSRLVPLLNRAGSSQLWLLSRTWGTAGAVQSQSSAENKLGGLWPPLAAELIYLAAGNNVTDSSRAQWKRMEGGIAGAVALSDLLHVWSFGDGVADVWHFHSFRIPNESIQCFMDCKLNPSLELSPGFLSFQFFRR